MVLQKQKGTVFVRCAPQLEVEGASLLWEDAASHLKRDEEHGCPQPSAMQFEGLGEVFGFTMQQRTRAIHCHSSAEGLIGLITSCGGVSVPRTY